VRPLVHVLCKTCGRLVTEIADVYVVTPSIREPGEVLFEGWALAVKAEDLHYPPRWIVTEDPPWVRCATHGALDLPERDYRRKIAEARARPPKVTTIRAPRLSSIR
jgi:hypothetical protein